MSKKLSKKEVNVNSYDCRISANLPASYIEFVNNIQKYYGGSIKSTISFAIAKYLIDHEPSIVGADKKKRIQIDIPKPIKQKMMNRIPREEFNQSGLIKTALNYLKFNLENFSDKTIYNVEYFIDFSQDISVNIKVMNFRDNYSKNGNVFNILGQTYIDDDEPPVLIELSCPIMLYYILLEKEIEVGKSYTITKHKNKFIVDESK